MYSWLICFSNNNLRSLKSFAPKFLANSSLIETFSGFRLEAEQIDMENQVKEIGLHTISVVLGPDTKFETTLEVIPETK